mgnify:FL=1|jgi:hypothetical protein
MTKFEKGELVKSTWHVGIGVILEIIPREDEMPAYLRKHNYDPMALVHWWFPEPLEGEGFQDGVDYEYLVRLKKV